VRRGWAGSLGCVRADVIADAESAIVIVRQRGLHRTRAEFDCGARVNFVSEFGDDSAEDSDLGEQLSFASFEFADPVVGLVELVVQCDESGRCRRHGTSSLAACGVLF
jgi:hypothetical protein